MTAELAAELLSREAAGELVAPDGVWDRDDPGGAGWVGEEDLYDELPPMSRVDALEWELWAGVEQDEAERFMLREKAPAWVFLPPGAELAAALEGLRPQYESPVALVEAMKAAARMEAWAASIKSASIASFYRQRKAQAVEFPRPSEVDSSGRPVDPERSWVAEVGAALHLSKETAARHIDTALHLTGTLSATHTALRCGALTWSKALSISEATRDLPTQAAQAVEAHVMRRAAGQTHRNLANALRRQVAKYAAKEEAERHREAVAERTCKIVPLSDGMAGLWVVHTADKIQQMWVVIQAMADLAKRAIPTDHPGTTTPDAGTHDNQPRTRTGSADAGAGQAGAHDEAFGNAPTGHGTAGTGHGTAGTGHGSAGTGHGSAGTGHGIDATHDPLPAPGANSAPPKASEPLQDSDASRHSATATGLQPDDDSHPAAGCSRSAGAAFDGPVKDERIAPQRRADVVADLFEQMLHNGLDWLGRRLPDRHRRRPHIEVLIPMNTLLGLDDDPAELSGYGPISADLARRIAGDGTWRRLLTDPATGAVLEAATTRHDPGIVVSETLLARHPVCAWPGCNRASRECDRDHGTSFAHSGETSLAGLAPFCEWHHVIKDTPAWGWSAENHPDGSVTLTAATGHRYTTVPPARGPITQPPHRQPAEPPPF